ncbi:MAG: 6,7-dimethyl-8-ribityllumazine synthase [Phycisphaerae bacterium]|nr:6,7-dimethyl-8-ribityllumazine synthase [Phycisphaerae bacterium]
MEKIAANLDARHQRLALVAARFNEFISERLVQGAFDALQRLGADVGRLTLVSVPGAFELPLVAQKLALSGKFDAIICLGCVVRGQTPHFEYVAGEAAKGIAQIGLTSGLPVVFGVITVDTLEQAIERAGGKAGNKGADAAATAVEMVNLIKRLST